MWFTVIKEVLGLIVGLAMIISFGWFIWWAKVTQSPEQAQATYDQYMDSSP